jgi:hypothetical protein
MNVDPLSANILDPRSVLEQGGTNRAGSADQLVLIPVPLKIHQMVGRQSSAGSKKQIDAGQSAALLSEPCCTYISISTP